MIGLKTSLTSGGSRFLRPVAAAALAVAVLASASAFAPAETKAQSGTNPIYWGAYNNGAPYSVAMLDQFEADAGKHQSIVFWGEPWAQSGAMQPFQTALFESVRQRGSIPMIGWTSWDISAPDKNTQPNFALAKITNGTYDAYITKWAQDAKAWGHPFFLRLDHEMNGWWFPWSEQLNGNHPGDYVKAWRHVHDIFSAVGVTNATWVWCANITSDKATSLATLYPGPSYVDWTQMDGYNFGTDGTSQWLTFDQIFGNNPWSLHDSYTDVLAVAPSKPMMIGETATSIHGGDAAAWIKDAMLTQLSLNYPQIKAFLWFNWNQNDTGLYWPIETTPSQQTAFQQSVASTFFAANTFSSLPPGVIQPIGGFVVPPLPSATPLPPTATPTWSAPATATVTPTPTLLPLTATPVSATAVPVGPATIILRSSADTYTNATNPNSAVGGNTTMLQASTDAAGAAFLQFDLTGLAGKTISYVQFNLLTGPSGSPGTYNIKSVSDNTWTEQSVTFNHSIAPSAIGATLGTLSAPAGYTWYNVVLPVSAIQARVGGKISFEIDSDTANVLTFSSRDQGTNDPQLIVGYLGAPTPTATPTWSASATPRATPTSPAAAFTATPSSSTPVPVGPATIRINSSADTYTDSTKPNSALGGTSVMLQASTDAAGPAFLQFDLSGLAGKTISYVQLNILTGAAGSPGSYNVKAVSNNTWTEQSVTFNNSIAPSAIGATLGTLSAPAGYTWYSVVLPVSAVQSQVGGKVSFEIDSDTANILSFSSRDQSTNDPQLIVGYLGAPTPTATPTWSASATPTATPTSPPPVYTATPSSATPVPAGPVTIRVGSSADTFTDSTKPTSAAGGTSVQLQASSDSTGPAFLRFDLAGLAGKTLTYVQLNILTGSVGSPGSYNVKAVSNNTWTEQSVTFNNPIAPSSIGATLGVLTAPAAYTWYGVTLPIAAVQSQLGGKISFEIDTDTASRLNFSSRDQSTNAPQLIVQYK